MQKHAKTEDSIRQVSSLAMVGTPHHDMASLCGISIKTLLKYYREELDRGKAKANATVAKTLYEMATVDKNLGACIFWMKAQAGWREVQVVQNQQLDKYGNPINPPKLGISFANGGPGMPLRVPADASIDDEEDRQAPDAPAGVPITYQ